MLKLILITLFTIVIISCKSNFKEVKIKEKVVYSEIVSSWAMCATSSNGIMNQLNSCAIITFLNRGVGYVIKNTLITESFSWTLDKESLKIFNKNNSVNSTFPDTFYFANFNKEKNIINLTLRHYDNLFYLSRFTESR